MTAEQIADLHQAIYDDNQDKAHELLKPLLDEREAPLTAATHLRDRVQMRPDHEWCRGDGDTPEPCGDAVALGEVNAAIKKAET